MIPEDQKGSRTDSLDHEYVNLNPETNYEGWVQCCISITGCLISPLATHNSTVTEQKRALLILGAIKCHWLSNNFIVSANVYRVIQKERSLFRKVILSVFLRKEKFTWFYNSEWLPSCWNLEIQEHCCSRSFLV
jgi:hypothetical protein